MGKYVIDSNSDKEIEKMVEITVAHIRKRIPGVKKIILIGGYGRGEGAFAVRNGKTEPINDFDFYIINDTVLDDDFLEEVALECSKLIGKGGLANPEAFEQRYDFNKFFHVDIRCLKESSLEKLPPTIRYFELPYAKAVWGESSVKLRKFSPHDIPLPEALRILMNRMMLLTMCFNPDFIKKKGYMNQEEKEIMLYYVAKSYLSCAEALLLLGGSYKPTYMSRAEEFSKIYETKFPVLRKEFPDLARKVVFYTNYKMKPDPEGLEAIKEWEECRNAIGAVYKKCIKEILGKEFSDWINLTEYSRKKLPKPYFMPYARDFVKINSLPKNSITERIIAAGAQAFFNFKYLQKVFSATGKFHLKGISLSDAGVKIINATPLVLFSISKNCRENSEMIELAGKIISDVYPAKEIKSWNSLKTEYLKAYRLYFLQRFV